MISIPDWTRFAVDTSKAGDQFATSCRPLYVVSHVAHVRTAWSIVEDGTILATLNGTKPALRTRRILVA